jgi:hypothetical protein
MKAKMQLWREGIEPFERIFDWNDVLETNNGNVLVSQISLYDERPIIDGEEHHIMHMMSAPNFDSEKY